MPRRPAAPRPRLSRGAAFRKWRAPCRRKRALRWGPLLPQTLPPPRPPPHLAGLAAAGERTPSF
eukprot:scaffold347_cov380-Prasinococcus_capsulatus_cf.AAC.2